MRSTPNVVIVADADTAIRTMLRHLLCDAGYQAVPYADPTECYRAARTLRPHLVLVDVSGRGRDAFWLAVLQMHADPVTRRIPVMLMTTNTPWLDQAQPLLETLGFSGVGKPFDALELLQTVAAICRAPARRAPPREPLAPTG
ncbi:MAG: hypothetical protein NTZ05_14675 [Chloroflexi bacterium]|nr:hypothetical protein [Chloroflexota bacterium]